jgi:hypothetical protein
MLKGIKLLGVFCGPKKGGPFLGEKRWVQVESHILNIQIRMVAAYFASVSVTLSRTFFLEGGMVHP